MPAGPKKGTKRSPEAIAKQKATLARKKRRGLKKAPIGAKSEFVRAHPTVAAPELVKLAAKQGLKLTASHVYNIRAEAKANGAASKPRQLNGPSSNAASIGELLEQIADAALEIKRRLSQLTL